MPSRQPPISHIAFRRQLETRVEWCPNKDLSTRTSTPAASKCVAKLCRRVWGVQGLVSPASRAVWVNARRADSDDRGRFSAKPGLEEHLQLPRGDEHVYMIYPLVVKDPKHKRPLTLHLEECGIETRNLLPLLGHLSARSSLLIMKPRRDTYAAVSVIKYK